VPMVVSSDGQVRQQIAHTHHPIYLPSSSSSFSHSLARTLVCRCYSHTYAVCGHSAHLAARLQLVLRDSSDILRWCHMGAPDGTCPNTGCHDPRACSAAAKPRNRVCAAPQARTPAVPNPIGPRSQHAFFLQIFSLRGRRDSGIYWRRDRQKKRGRRDSCTSAETTVSAPGFFFCLSA
jgi:hypothetical protein